MVQWDNYIEQLKDKIKQLEPYRIILFGSVSRNEGNEESDLDVLVVLNSSAISKSYQERMSNKLLVRHCIYELSKQIPIDLLVYTRKEYERIQNNRNSFFKEIEKTGRIIYEAAG
jgi:predicted nucleotidyltransferase